MPLFRRSLRFPKGLCFPQKPHNARLTGQQDSQSQTVLRKAAKLCFAVVGQDPAVPAAGRCTLQSRFSGTRGWATWPRLTATDIRPVRNFVNGFCLKMRPQRASTCWIRYPNCLGLACCELAAFGSSLSVQPDARCLELMRLHGSLAKRLTPDLFASISRP